jgi:phosphoglycolate phosphatase
MSKLIIFDVDGTFLDTYSMYNKVVESYSRERNMPFPCIQSIHRGYGDPAAYDFKWGVSREDQVVHMRATFDMFDAWSVSGETDKTPGLFEGVKETLTELKDHGNTLAIVTAKKEDPLLHLLQYHGMEKMFAAQRNWTDIKRRGYRGKPHPDKVLSVMKELNFHPEDAVMIGDTTMDIGAGIAAGSKTIGVTWGAHHVDLLREAGAHHIVDTKFNDLTAVIKKIFT